jgi:hypothetical protein
VDRLPLVSSAIINVDQDVDSDWPIEVYDHSGRGHNVSMKPGDMVLYESHTVLHGRPFPMQGKHYVSCNYEDFISFITDQLILQLTFYFAGKYLRSLQTH